MVEMVGWSGGAAFRETSYHKKITPIRLNSRKPWKVKRCEVKVNCKLGMQCDTTREVAAI